jgi:short subunit fatty acids transporter
MDMGILMGVFRETWAERFGLALSRNVERWMPDPLIFALILVLITILMAIVIMKPYEVMSPPKLWSGYL